MYSNAYWKFTLIAPGTFAGNPATLRAPEPAGWDGAKITIQRKQGWYGFCNEFALNLEWRNGEWADDPNGPGTRANAATWLRAAYLHYGIEAEIYAVIEFRPNLWDAWAPYYRGLLNFRNLSFNANGTVSCDIERADGLEKLLSRLGTPVDLLGTATVDGGTRATAYPVHVVDIDGQPVRQIFSATWLPEDDGSHNPPKIPPANLFVYEENVGPTSSTTQRKVVYEFPYINIEVDEVNDRLTPPGVLKQLVDPDEPFLVATRAGVYTFTLQNFSTFIEARVTQTNPGDLDSAAVTFELIFRHNTTEYPIDGDTNSEAPVSGSNVNLAYTLLAGNWSQQITVAPGDELFFFARVTFDADPNGSQPFNFIIEDFDVLSSGVVDKGRIRLIADTFFPATKSRALLVYDAFNTVVEAISENGLDVVSDYLGRTDGHLPHPAAAMGAGANLALMLGLHLRGLGGPEITDFDTNPFTYHPSNFNPYQPLFASFEDLRKNLAAIYGLGFGIEPHPSIAGRWVVRIEPVRYFYAHPTPLFTLEYIDPIEAKLTREVDTAYCHTAGRFGYRTWQPEDNQGLDELCSIREYATHLSRQQNLLEQVSDFVAAGYLIETTRRKQWTSITTQDAREDELVFVLRVDRADLTQVEKAINTGAANANLLYPGDRMNAYISPLRNAARWRWLLQAGERRSLSAFTPRALFAAADGNYTARFAILGAIPTYSIYGLIATHDLRSLQDEDDNLHGTTNSVGYLDAGFTAWVFPEAVALTVPLSRAQVAALRASPMGLITLGIGPENTLEDFFLVSAEIMPNPCQTTLNLLPYRPESY